MMQRGLILFEALVYVTGGRIICEAELISLFS